MKAELSNFTIALSLATSDYGVDQVTAHDTRAFYALPGKPVNGLVAWFAIFTTP